MNAVRLFLNVWLTGAVGWSLLTLWRIDAPTATLFGTLAVIVGCAWLTAHWPRHFSGALTALIAAAAAASYFQLPVALPALHWLDRLSFDYAATIDAWQRGDPTIPQGLVAQLLLVLVAYGFSLLVWLSGARSRRALLTATIGGVILSAEWLVHHDAALTAAAYFLPGALTHLAATRATELTGAVMATGAAARPVRTMPLTPVHATGGRQRLTWIHLRIVALAVLAALFLTGAGLALPSHFATVDLGLWRDRLQARLPLLADLRGTAVRRLALTFDLQQLGFGGSDDELGGPVRTSKSIALTLTVRGSQLPDSLYLRGRAPSYYTGRGWVPGSEQPVSTSIEAPPGQLHGQASQTSLVADIQPQGLRTRTLFTLLEPIRLQTVGDVHWLHDLTAVGTPAPGVGDTYTVTARQPLYSDDEIYRLTAAGGPAAAVPDEYLSVPVTLPERVASLAAEVAAGHEHPYDQILAIERFLRGYEYNLEAERPPEGADFVDYFLFEQPTGYCVYHASAMTVMLRTLGIPARYVTGFRVALDGRPGSYSVLNDMAHAWVEAYVPGYGWMTFEPTPAFPVPERAQTTTGPIAGTDRAQTDQDREPSERPDDVFVRPLDPAFEDAASTVPAPRTRAGGLSWQLSLTAALAAAIVWVVGAIMTDRGPRIGSPEAAVTVFALASRLFVRSGLNRSGGMTATEQVRAAARRWPAVKVPLQTMLRAYLPARYGDGASSRSPTHDADTGSAAVEAWQRVRRGVRGYQGWLRYYWRLLRQRLPVISFRRRGAGPSAS